MILHQNVWFIAKLTGMSYHKEIMALVLTDYPEHP